jgi:uncharacterized membrane protein YeaQ/YmgE (transglycosylase-associated protein family)
VSPGVLVTWAVVGLITGCLAHLIVRSGGYGPTADVLLGLAGSAAGGAICQALEIPQEAERFAMVAVVFAGASSLIAAQRMWCRGA